MNEYCKKCEKTSWDKYHHDNEYGFPVRDDFVLFERLCWEVFQAGLSWSQILKKRDNFKEAFDNFDYYKVAKYGDDKILKLLENKGIIRNKLKIKSIIHNANVAINLKEEHGSFYCWLKKNQEKKLSLDEWIKLFKKTFKFTGKEITNEFLMSVGIIEGAHSKDCPIYNKIKNIKRLEEK